MASRDDYASLALSSISWFTPANKHVFPELCKGKFTDVDLYCATGTSDLCCGLCPNVRPFPFLDDEELLNTCRRADFGFRTRPVRLGHHQLRHLQSRLHPRTRRSLGSRSYAGHARERLPLRWVDSRVGGRVGRRDGEVAGPVLVAAGSRMYAPFFSSSSQKQPLTPSSSKVIFIMAPAILTPQWARLGRSQLDMEKMLIRLTGDARRVTRAQLREAEVRLVKRQHQTWSWCVLTFWFVNMVRREALELGAIVDCIATEQVFWTVGFVWASRADIDYAQPNCDDVVQPTLTPVIASTSLPRSSHRAR